MARRTFQVSEVVEVLQHWHAGRPKTVVAASLGVDVKTIRKYVAAAEAEGIRTGDGLVSDRAGWAARVAAWFPELVDAQARSRTWPELEGRRELITKMIETNTLATVHQRLRDEHGVAASESSLRRYVGQAFGGPPIAPGDGAAAGRAGREAQIDYGYLGSWVDPVGGRLRRVQAFVIVLACSRHMFVRPVLRMDATSWVAAHIAAWEFFGGVPLRLVIDNLEDRRDPGRPLRPVDQPGLCGDGRALRLPDRPGEGPEAEGQAPGRTSDPVRAGLVLARTQLRQPDRHADPGGELVSRGGRGSGASQPRRRQPAGGVRRARGAGAAGVAGPAVRAGPLAVPEGRARLPHRGGQGAVFGAMDPRRGEHRHSGHRHHRGGARRRQAGQELAQGAAGPLHR